MLGEINEKKLSDPSDMDLISNDKWRLTLCGPDCSTGGFSIKLTNDGERLVWMRILACRSSMLSSMVRNGGINFGNSERCNVQADDHFEFNFNENILKNLTKGRLCSCGFYIDIACDYTGLYERYFIVIFACPEDDVFNVEVEACGLEEFCDLNLSEDDRMPLYKTDYSKLGSQAAEMGYDEKGLRHFLNESGASANDTYWTMGLFFEKMKEEVKAEYMMRRLAGLEDERGVKWLSTKFCSSCGERIRSGARYCVNCGKKLI